MSAGYLLKNISHLVCNARQVIHNTDLLITGDKIVAIGEKARAAESHPGVSVIPAEGNIVFPGFVNTHTHLYQSLLKGMSDHLGLEKWCQEVTFPLAQIVHDRQRVANDEELGYCYGMLGAIEMIKGGTTAFVDFDIIMDRVLEAWDEVGVRAVAGLQNADKWIPDELKQERNTRDAAMLSTIDRWHGKNLLSVALAPSTPFACTEEYLLWQKELAERRNLKIFIHVAETKWEVEQSLHEVGMSPLRYLDSLNFLSERVCIVHGVWLDQKEIELLRDRGVQLSYNPKSNGKLGSGIAPIRDCLNQGVPVGLANDGPASNDLLDMFEEMRMGVMMQKLRVLDATAMTAEDIFDVATRQGAGILGLNAGVLEEGKLADLVILDPDKVHMQPLHDVIQSLVYCAKASDVVTVFIHGVPVVMDGKVTRVNEDAVLQQAKRVFWEKYTV